MISTIAPVLEKAGSADDDAVMERMAGPEVTSPFGPITWRAIDHQATMIDWRCVGGATVMPSDDEMPALRSDS